MSDTSISPGPGPDIFLLFYIKHRIEQDSELQWFEAPYCCEENPPLEWDSVKEAALLFESDNRKKMNETVIQLLEPADRLNFRIFRKIVRHYMDKLAQEDDNTIAILALITFTGLYARRLAELDVSQQQRIGEEPRDFRREIYQVSIYGSRILLSTLSQNWEPFCAEIAKIMKQVRQKKSEYHQTRSVSPFRLASGFPPLCGFGIPLVALCGFGAAAYIFLRRSCVGAGI